MGYNVDLIPRKHSHSPSAKTTTLASLSSPTVRTHLRSGYPTISLRKRLPLRPATRLWRRQGVQQSCRQHGQHLTVRRRCDDVPSNAKLTRCTRLKRPPRRPWPVPTPALPSRSLRNTRYSTPTDRNQTARPNPPTTRSPRVRCAVNRSHRRPRCRILRRISNRNQTRRRRYSTDRPTRLITRIPSKTVPQRVITRTIRSLDIHPTVSSVLCKTKPILTAVI